MMSVVSVGEAGAIDIAFSLGYAPARRSAPGALSVVVVPPAAAWPGYGAFVVAPGTDHVTVCKPDDDRDVRYALARDLVLEAVVAVRGAGAGAG